jgi:hypothetical protein
LLYFSLGGGGESNRVHYWPLVPTTEDVDTIQFFIIYVPSQQLQGQLQTQHSVGTRIIIIIQFNLIIITGKVKTPSNYNVLTIIMIIIIIIIIIQ